MVEIVEQAHGPENTSPQKSDAQWVEIFACYFILQQHVTITTPKGTTKESVVTRVNHDSVNTAAIYGANQQIPFASIKGVRRIGAAEMVLDPRITQTINRFAGYMARGAHLRLETEHGVIEEAMPCCLTLSGVDVIDAANDLRVTVPFGEIKQVTVPPPR